MKCDYCKKEHIELNELILDGVDDIYKLEVCNECKDFLIFVKPEEMDKIIAKT